MGEKKQIREKKNNEEEAESSKETYIMV